MRYFAYCRKSTEEEDRQILSIESQTNELRRHAEKEHLQIVEVLQESRSAKTPGRPVFNEMVRRIEHGEADGILAWHPDRLARNALDGGHIIHLLDCGKLLDLKFPTYTFENTSQGKFMLGMMFVQSKYYVDSLSENVRRGNRTKREKGWYPAYAPIGYLNARSEMGEKIIIPDPERFTLVKNVWELFLTGAYSVPQLQLVAEKQLGLTTRKKRKRSEKPFGRTGIYNILKRPFYTGHIVYKGTWHKARHQPMITIEQYEQAQRILTKDTRNHPKRHLFAYAGLLRCGTCQGTITAEEHQNRYGYHYRYYHCTHKSRNTVCRERSVEEEDLEQQILAFLEEIRLDDADLKAAFAAINKQAEQAADISVKQSVEAKLAACGKSLDNLTRLRVDDLITDEEFLRQRKDLLQIQEGLHERLRKLDTSNWIEPSEKLFLFSNRAKYWLVHGSPELKRQILATVGSNLLLRDRTLSIDAKKPFRALRERASRSLLCGVVTAVRTFFESEGSFSIPTLPAIPKRRGKKRQ